ncbi:hypothetical protein M9Y10_039587 [Tritrichomonas musculus]|uniref:Signal sequence receptor subunit alpha n=1 Tax=Tritrichomonas musculus TaxID=1915356 RepID=A0ABR2KC95_9EUKA
MIAFYIALVASATDATYIKDHLAGNWSATLTHPGLQPSEYSHFHVCFNELPTKSFEAAIFEDENATTPVTIFSISFIDGSTVSIKSDTENEDEATRVSISLGMKYHHTAVGSYKQYVFNFNYANPNRIHITLFDNEKDEMTIIHLVKEVPQKTIFQKYGMTVFAVLAFGLSMFLNYKFKPVPQPAQQQPKQQPKQQNKKVEIVEKEKENEENSNEEKENEEHQEKNESNDSDQKKNTRDDEDENGKVKTE